MKDVFNHLDRIKKIFKEKEVKTHEKNNNILDKNSQNRLNYLVNSLNYNNYNTSIQFKRPSILNLNQVIKNIDFSQKYYLIENSSDSEDCINEESKVIFPSLRKVAKNLFDPNKIMILTDIKYFPKEANPGLIMTGLEDWVTEKHIKYFLQNVPSFIDLQKKNNHHYNDNYLDIHKIKIFVEQQKRFAFIKMNSFSQMEAIGNFFLNPIKKMYPSYNSKNEKIEIYYAYNILNLTKNHWYGVILRNLPANCDDKSLYNFTDQRVEDGIKYCLNPIVLDNVYCALIVCKELEYAEKLCFDLNNREINNKSFKANLHPNTCKIRNKENYNNYGTFCKNGYEFREEADESEKCIQYAKYFTEFFFPNYINSFKYNKNKKKEEETNKNTDKNNSENKNNKEKDKEKSSKKKKDFVLASSILNLFKKSKGSEEKKRILSSSSNQNLNKNITNNKVENRANSNNKTSENSNKIIKEENIPNKTNISSFNNLNNESSKELVNSSNQLPALQNDKNNDGKKENIDNKKIENNNKDNNISDGAKEPGEMSDANKEKNPIYTEEEIKYYTYDMKDKNYYEEKEKEQQQRRTYYKYKKTNYPYNNFNNNYNSYNNSFKKYEYKNNNSPPHHHNYSTSYKNYKKYNYRENNRERDYSNENYNKVKERSREKSRDISRERYNEEEKMNKNRNIRNNNYNGYDLKKDNNRYLDDRNRTKKFNEIKYYDKDRKYNYYDRERDHRKSSSKDKYEKMDNRYIHNNNYNNYSKNKFK